MKIQFSRAEIGTLGGAAAATGLAAFTAHADVGEVPAFVAAAAALSLLAATVGAATEQLGHRLGPGATGMLQAAFGNLPELLICLFSLRAGLVDVVRGALVGAVLANTLLVLGLAILVGGLRHGTQRFPTETPRMVATMLVLAVAALAVPTLAHVLHTPAQAHEATLSAACAVVLLVLFACSLPFSLKANPAMVAANPDAKTELEHAWPIGQSLVVLGAAGLAAALASEWFVDALLPATKAIGLTEGFTGLVVVAIAGNAVENVVGIKLAAQNKPDYALSVILNSALQVALALTPVLVLASFVIAPAPLTLVLPPLLVAALGLTVGVTALIVSDGESIWLEGVALLCLYAMIAAAFFWG
ncbi:calcium/proton antiporter, CaCA family [Gemmatirosa kalamazoonensis]|uniref:Ca(2+)/H(+) antiporter n=1 Tax=Gemmatirosa kalamazoonensis TaxID=861299 RepID=W0R929_9BACT|nr:calcium/proton exchanger [Gemmatirosa kalamazoonensis]AHG87624.1 calcium/proton antiporter, CaCA family [Gemmatirosa kalamazoonensis]